jgi:Na+/phosphate symporter
MVAYLSIIIAVIGILMYFVSTNPKVQRVGEIMFGAGLLAFLIAVGGQAIGVLGK